MTRIDIDYYLDHEETLPGRHKGKGKKRGPATEADLERRQQEIQAARQARVEEVEKKLPSIFLLFRRQKPMKAKNKFKVISNG